MNRASAAFGTSTLVIKNNPAFVFVVLASLIGIIYSVFIPYGAGFDEERHIVRIYDLSGGYLLPNRNPPSFKSTVTRKEFDDLSYQRRFIQSPAFDLFDPETFWMKFGKEEADLVYGYVGGSIYSPVIFFPQAIVARISWRKFDFPILPIMILMRVAGLLIYIIGGWLAIRLLPVGKWVMAILALAPMAVFQAVTFNADGFTNAASFLFIAATLHVYASQLPKILPHQIWLLVGCALLLGVAKPGAIILLPLLLILSMERFASPKWYVILGLGALFAILLNLGWIALTIPNSKFSSGGSDSLSRQFGLVFSQPLDFLVTYAKGIFNSFSAYIKDWIAAYGYWAGEVPGPVYPFYILLLITTILIEPRSDLLKIRARSLMTVIFLLCSAAILTLYFIIYYSPGNTSALGRHGRYFIAFAPLFFIALTGLIQIQDIWKPLIRIAAIGSFLIMISSYSFGIYTTYYTDCGYQAYVGGKCILPIYKNLEKEGVPEIQLNAETTISQAFTSQCRGVEAVEVFVKSVPANGTGMVTFAVLDENQRRIAAKTFTISDIPAFTYLSLPVSPAAGSHNSNFEIQLEASSSTSPNGIGLGYIAGGFQVGELVVAGETIRGDLLFHYTCTSP